MVKVISVKFRGNCRSYYFDPGEEQILTGDGVIVETARGEEFGDVVEGVKEIDEVLVPAALKPIIRRATEEDARMRREFIAKESEAFMLCQDRITDHKLDMKLVDVEYTYNGSKIVFYFTADERVDFRDLVKDLAYALRTRIELRQIGVRDEAKMLGGLGPCGRPVCCKAFLDDFRPVSIKMAKEQNLSLSPTKISGLCGRLMCCLQYEQYAYEEAHKRLPRVGKELETPEGTGIVTECNVLTERVKVRLTQEDGSFEVKEFACADVGAGSFGKQPTPKGDTLTQEADTAKANAPAPAPAAQEKKNERSGEQRDRHSRHDRPRREKPAEANGETGKGAENAASEEKKNAEERRENGNGEHKNGENRRRDRSRNGEKKNGEEHRENGNGEHRNGENRHRDRNAEHKNNEEHRNGENKAGEGAKNGEKAENTPRRENSRRHGRGNRPAGEKPVTEKSEKPAGETASAEKSGITRLPGETIGMGKQEQASEAPKAAAPFRHSNLHRKHSFGPRS